MSTETIVPDLEIGAGGEGAVEQVESAVAQPDANQQRQADREYEKFIKSLREDGDAAKHYRRIKDDYGRIQAIQKLEPKGIDGLRTHYDTVNGIAHGDKTGIEAVQSIQSALAESQTVLDAIAQGNVDSLPDEQQEGILRMAPSIIENLKEGNPEAYTALLLPEFMEALNSSALVGSFNGLIDSLNEKPPTWLTKEQLGQWTLDRITRISQFAGQMGQWFQTQDQRVRELGGKGGKEAGRFGGANGREKPEATQGGAANQEFYKSNIYPQTDAHATESFIKELRPWDEKLQKVGIRLSQDKKQSLLNEMTQQVIGLAKKNPEYVKQMGRYERQRSPDAASVISTFRSEFNKHAKTVLESLVRRDYGQMLDKPAGRVTKPAAGAKPAAVPAGVKVVSVKPSRDRIDFQRTPTDWIYENKWRLRDGSVVQYRP